MPIVQQRLDRAGVPELPALRGRDALRVQLAGDLGQRDAAPVQPPDAVTHWFGSGPGPPDRVPLAAGLGQVKGRPLPVALTV